MPITIGGRMLATTRPADLDERLIATTGCSAAEHANMLTHGGDAFQIARALQPMLAQADAMPVADLAALIAQDDGLRLRQETVTLLKSEPTAPAPVAEVAAPVVLPTLPAEMPPVVEPVASPAVTVEG